MFVALDAPSRCMPAGCEIDGEGCRPCMTQWQQFVSCRPGDPMLQWGRGSVYGIERPVLDQCTTRPTPGLRYYATAPGLYTLFYLLDANTLHESWVSKYLCDRHLQFELLGTNRHSIPMEQRWYSFKEAIVGTPVFTWLLRIFGTLFVTKTVPNRNSDCFFSTKGCDVIMGNLPCS